MARDEMEREIIRLTRKENTLRYLRGRRPDDRFDMADGHSCLYHAILEDAFGERDDIGAYLDCLRVGETEVLLDESDFAVRFQSVAMGDGAGLNGQTGHVYWTVRELIEIARDLPARETGGGNG